MAMQQGTQPRPKTVNLQAAPSRLRRQGFLETPVPGLALSVFALLAVPAILGGKNLAAQTHAPQATKTVRHQKAAAKPVPETIAAQPPASPAPIWPANQPPNKARVSWDSRGLEIEASNSSLNQILRQVAADTGTKVEGLTHDQRIFGSYGPGPGRDVLLKLLDGSGYNVLMTGGRDADTPLKIVLSARSHVGPQAAENNQSPSNSEDDEADKQLDDTSEPPPPPTVQQQFATGNDGLSKDPDQFMQDILQRQQKIDEQPQQQQDQQSNPPQ